jgi:hypothetical protein
MNKFTLFSLFVKNGIFYFAFTRREENTFFLQENGQFFQTTLDPRPLLNIRHHPSLLEEQDLMLVASHAPSLLSLD